jgi:hypothetical protein
MDRLYNVTVTVISAKDLARPAGHKPGNLNAFVTVKTVWCEELPDHVKLKNSVLYKTQVVKGSTKPKWERSFVVEVCLFSPHSN